MTIPNVKSDWLDLRATGGLRYRMLDWGGSGKLVLFLHGGSLCAGIWGPVIARLSGVHGIAYDLRGHGDTDAPDASHEYAWSLFGADFLRVLDAVEEQYGRAPDAIVTHSFAGDCALIAGLLHWLRADFYFSVIIGGYFALLAAYVVLRLPSLAGSLGGYWDELKGVRQERKQLHDWVESRRKEIDAQSPEKQDDPVGDQ